MPSIKVLVHHPCPLGLPEIMTVAHMVCVVSATGKGSRYRFLKKGDAGWGREVSP